MVCKDKVQESLTSTVNGIGKHGQKFKTVNKSRKGGVIISGNRCAQSVRQPVSSAKMCDILV